MPSDDSNSTWGSQNRRVHEESLKENDDDSVSSISDDYGEKRRRRSVSSREAADFREVPEDEIEDPSAFDRKQDSCDLRENVLSKTP